MYVKDILKKKKNSMYIKYGREQKLFKISKKMVKIEKAKASG